MTLSQIQYFLAVAECGSFSSAAKKLFVSQPAVSKQVLSLEQDLEFPLFYRANNSIRLTQGGRALADALNEANMHITAVLEHIRRDSAEDRRCIRIACADTWDAAAFFQPLSECLAEHDPKMTLRITGLPAAQMYEAVQNGDIAMAIGNRKCFGDDLACRNLGFMRCGLLYSRQLGTDLRPEDLAMTDVFLPSSDSAGMGEVIREQLRSLGCMMGRRLSSRYNEAAVGTLCGCGVMIVSRMAALIGNSKLVFCPLSHILPIGLYGKPLPEIEELMDVFAPILQRICCEEEA